MTSIFKSISSAHCNMVWVGLPAPQSQNEMVAMRSPSGTSKYKIFFISNCGIGSLISQYRDIWSTAGHMTTAILNRRKSLSESRRLCQPSGSNRLLALPFAQCLLSKRRAKGKHRAMGQGQFCIGPINVRDDPISGFMGGAD